MVLGRLATLAEKRANRGIQSPNRRHLVPAGDNREGRGAPAFAGALPLRSIASRPSGIERIVEGVRTPVERAVEEHEPEQEGGSRDSAS